MMADLAAIQLFLFPLMLGAVTTIAIACGAFVLATLLGFALASARYLWPSRLLNGAIQVFVEIYRNVPSLTHLFILYFGLAYLGIRLSSIAAAIIGLGLIGAAGLSEVYRAAFQAVPAGQREAALSMGLRPLPSFRLIVLPQAWRLVLPPLGNYAVQLIKDTSLVAAIAAPEIMFTARNLVVNTFQTTLVYLLATLIYLALCLPLVRFLRSLERRMAVAS
jgi:His/Glu/Gln/Arg/opine family amino acid ABC transporter permease subunit